MAGEIQLNSTTMATESSGSITAELDTIRPNATNGSLTLQGDSSDAGVTGLTIDSSGVVNTTTAKVTNIQATSGQSLTIKDEDGNAAITIGTDFTAAGYLSLNFGSYHGDSGGAGGGSLSANTLDDYEEGTWTANWTASGSAPTNPATATGHYTKIGNLVTCVVRFTNKNLSGASGEMKVDGLPFNVKDTGGSPQGVCNFYGQSFPADTIYVTALVSTGGYVYFLAVKEGAAWADVSITTGTGKYMELTVTYFAS